MKTVKYIVICLIIIAVAFVCRLENSGHDHSDAGHTHSPGEPHIHTNGDPGHPTSADTVHDHSHAADSSGHHVHEH